MRRCTTSSDASMFTKGANVVGGIGQSVEEEEQIGRIAELHWLENR